jgi:hypothetical protein
VLRAKTNACSMVRFKKAFLKREIEERAKMYLCLPDGMIIIGKLGSSKWPTSLLLLLSMAVGRPRIHLSFGGSLGIIHVDDFYVISNNTVSLDDLSFYMKKQYGEVTLQSI